MRDGSDGNTHHLERVNRDHHTWCGSDTVLRRTTERSANYVFHMARRHPGFANGGEAYAQDWVPDPIHLWARMEEGNMALLQLRRYDAVYPRIDAFAGNDDVIFAPPPSPSDYTMMTPPPSYAEATLYAETTSSLSLRWWNANKSRDSNSGRGRS